MSDSMKPRRIEFPLFEIASSPTIDLTQIKSRRFDLLERYQMNCDHGKAFGECEEPLCVASFIHDS